MIKKSTLTILGLLFLFQSFAQPDNNLIPCRLGDRFGYCKSDKSIVIAFKYQEAGIFTDGLAKSKTQWKIRMD